MQHIKWLKQFKRFIKIKANAQSRYFNIIFFPVKKKPNRYEPLLLEDLKH